ncbi:MAG UNVERIFIED_CONTAM: GntR family transcriptional regulator [Microcystis novacekii LVE1205-3]
MPQADCNQGGLPSIRVLAEQLLVNPNTIARAYRELETAGVVEKDKRQVRLLPIVVHL